MTPRIVSLITACCAAALVASGCSSSSSTAGGSDNPDFLYGVATLPDSSGADSASIELVPVDFGGIGSDSSAIVRTLCDSLGRFNASVIHGTTYNLIVSHKSSGRRAMVGNVVSRAPNDTIAPFMLTAPSTFKIQISDSLTTGTVFLLGTLRSCAIESAITRINGYRELVFDSIPAGVIPPVVLQGADSSKQVIATDVSVTAGDTVSVVAEEGSAEVKPLSDFRIVVGLSEGSIAQLGSEAALRATIQGLIDRVNSCFADPRITSFIHYTIDSVYVFPDSTINSQNMPLADSFALRLLINSKGGGSFGNWAAANRTANHEFGDTANGGLSSDASFGYLMWAFGLSRGCFYVSYANVNAAENPINGASFSTPPTYLNCDIDSGWSAYDVGTINAYGASIDLDPYENYRAFPSVIGIECVDSSGAPAVSRRVNIYSVKRESAAVDSVASFSGTTDVSGRFLLSTNPYMMGSLDQMVNTNALVEVEGVSKSYAWMPVYEAGAAYYDGVTGIWYKRVVVSD